MDALGGVTFSTAGGKTISSGRTLNLNGISSWGAGGVFFNGGTLVNQAGGVLTTTTNDAMTNFGGTNQFTNAGTFTKSAGTLTTTIGIPFSNTGTVNASSGTVSMTSTVAEHSGTTLTGGTWNVTNGATLNFSSGSNLTTIGSAASVSLDGASSTFNRVGPVTASTLTTNQGNFTLKNDRDITTASAFSNSGTVSIEDSATLFRIGASGSLAYTQTGGYTILAGGAMIDASAFNLNGGTLGGTGTIDAPLTTSGTTTIAPGSSPGALAVLGIATLASGNTFAVEVGGLTQGTQYDWLDVSGVLTLAGLLDVDFISSFENSVLPSDVFYIATAGSPIQGAFSNVASGNRIGTNTSKSFEVWYGTGSPYGENNLVLTQAPEPGRVMLLLACIGALSWKAQRRRRRK